MNHRTIGAMDPVVAHMMIIKAVKMSRAQVAVGH
jgi:hypothetical protein